MRTQQLLQSALEHHQSGRLAQAEDLYRKILVLEPNQPDALHLLGLLEHHRGKHDVGAELIRKAIRINPREGRYYGNLGNVLGVAKKYDEAIAAYSAFLAMTPNEPRAHYNLGNVFREMGLLDDAVESFRAAVKYDPNYGQAYANLGDALNRSGKIEEAIATHREAIRLMPGDPSAHINLALALLLKGEFEEGLREKEWRKKLPSFLGQRQFSQPQWDGRELEGKRILIQCEQGLGDSIHFGRYCAMVAHRGGSVVLCCDPQLKRLFKHLAGVDALVSEYDEAGECDFQAQLMSLPLIFKTNLSNIPAKIPYLSAEPELVEFWKSKLAAGGSGFKVGLIWAGNPKHLEDRARSMKLAEFAPLSQVADVQFHSLQKSETAPPKTELNLIDWTAELTDFADTAAMIANLDLVISVDTSVAHLAGALGKPTWLLIPFTPDWRWLRDRDDTPWYPTMRLFRQSKPGNWGGVIQHVRDALATFPK